VSRRSVVLLALVGALVLALFLLGVAAADDGGRADPDDAPLLDGVHGFLGGLPGLGRDLTTDDLTGVACLDGDRLVVDDGGCRIAVEAEVDRVRVQRVAGSCRLVVAQEGALTQRLDDGDLATGEETSIALVDERGRIDVLAAQLDGSCVLRLVDG
jgi:hypothetical protein